MKALIPFPAVVALAALLAPSACLFAGSDSCPGLWRSLEISTATGGVADIVSLPDGTLVVGLKAGGLRLYGRTAGGTYSWRSITADRGGPLASNKVTCLALFLGDLWVGTQDAGISILDGVTGSWSDINTANSALPSNSINHLTPVKADPSIAAPKTTDETLWASTTAGAALYHYVSVGALRGWIWTVTDSSDGLPDNHVYDTAVQFRSGERYMWFGLSQQLVRWDGRTFVSYAPNVGGANSGVDTAERIMVDASNRVWFAAVDIVAGIGPGDGGGGGLNATSVPVGLYRLSTSGIGINTWTKFPQQFGGDMSLDGAGRLWTCRREHFVAESEGAWVHDQGTWCVFKQPDKPITSNRVNSVHAMGELCWFGQDASLDLDSFTTNWTRRTKQVLQLADNVGPIAFREERPFVGGFQGFSYLFKLPNVWIYVPLSVLPSDKVTSILPVDDGLWVGLSSDGLRFVGMNFSTMTVAGIDAYRAADGLAGDGVQAIARDKGGRLWVGTSGGLSLRGGGYWLNFTPANSPLADSAIRALSVAGGGRLWIGTAAGISVLDPEAQGAGAWASHTTVNGLASNDVRGLAASADGVVWAATAGGACEWDPAMGNWTTHSTAGEQLPSNLVLSLAIDSSGRTWVGTDAGLAVREAGAWRHYHVTGSTLASDVVTHLGTNGTELWATAGNEVAVRDDIVGPIGEFPPTITSFAPAPQAPGGIVIVTGTNFDDRGPQYNEVFVGHSEGTGGGLSQPSEIVSVTPTHLSFRVRDLAQDGRIRVVSHCLQAESAAILKIGPKISFFTPSCAALGDQITIHGAGFTVAGGSQVRFGNGPWRNPVLEPGGELRFDLIRIRLQQGDESGQIQVRRQDGAAVATSTQTLSIGHLELVSRHVQQGVEGLRLIWGKRTLVYLKLKAVGCNTKVTGGKIYWKKKDGTRQRAGKAYSRIWDQPIALEVATEGEDVNDDDFSGLEYVGEFESNRSSFGAFFPLSELAAIECTVENHGVEALNVEIPASELNFKEIKRKLALISMGVLRDENPTPWSDFWSMASAALIDAARIMPQPDFGPFYGSQAWLDIRSTFITEDSADLESSLPTSDFYRINARVDDLIEPGFGQFGMAIIDPVLYADDPDGGTNPSGKAWVSPGAHDKTAVSYVFSDKGAATIVQELCHMLGLVDGGAANHDDDNGGHSLYDECTEFENDEGEEECSPNEYKTYSEAVKDQLGIEYPRLRHISDGAPIKIDTGLTSDWRAKSSMSYAPGKRNWNSFLEPVDYQATIAFLNDLYQDSLDGDGGGAGIGGEGTTLNLRFTLTTVDEVIVTSSYLDDSGEPASEPDPDARHRIVVRDAGGAAILELPFAAGFHTHNDDASTVRFAMRIPFGDDARTVEIRHDDEVLWSRSRSAKAPVVSFTAPAGGTISADSTVPVSWTASDADGDALQFALDYSADGGATWIKLPQYLTGTSYSWRPGFLPRSRAARLRIRASDGFNTTTALSAQFQLTPAQPVVAIRSPVDGAQIPEGSLVDLVAISFTSEGAGLGSFEWKVDGTALPGTANGTEFRFDLAGQRTVFVTLTDSNGLLATRQVTVNVYPDFDHDGLPNDWEQAHGLNPLDFTDASKDPDEDGLSSFAEHHHGTDPQDADTDNDGAPDGAEIVAGTDPLDPSSAPPTVPTMHLGPTQVGFTMREGDAVSEPSVFWVTNPGPGDVNWSVQNGVSWLDVSPASGAAPSEVTLVAMPNGLGVGEYEGQIVFSAPGAQESPHAVKVKLTIHSGGPDHDPRFIRGDSNSDGKVNISDASSTLVFLFVNATKAPLCLDAADATNDGIVNITDPIYSLNFLFLGGPAIPEPSPACGVDPTPDALDCGRVPVCE